MRVSFVRIDVDRALKALARLIKLATGLVNQTQVVVRRRIARVDRCCFQILLERAARALRADDALEVPAQKNESKQQEKRRSRNVAEQGEQHQRQWQAGERRQEEDGH